ncbi:type II toxin-antitoxin system VapC family toxin [Chitinophaga sp.]|uniref:type II toxin-antitoxin system VapC family toxin n=1 Tax=Chitinophaga sp. TaxID=1869181 RepID=UPI002F920F05
MKQPLLFDTSVWIDFMRENDTPQTDLLNHYVQNGYETPVIPVVVQEILQGIRDDAEHRQTRESLLGFTTLEIPPMIAAQGAAALFRSLRKKGITIRKSNDCVIAFYALSFDLEIVHKDSDFDLICSHSNVKTWEKDKG